MILSTGRDGTPSLGAVLVLDDNQIDQMMCERVLKRSKLATELISFLDAEKALAYLRMDVALPIDTVLLDVNLPGMDGAEFLEAIRDDKDLNCSANVLVMVSATLPKKLQSRFAASPLVKGFVDKPLTVQELMAAAPISKATETVQL